MDATAEAELIRGQVGAGGRLIAAPDGGSLMVDSSFGAFDGPVATGPLLRIGLMTQGAGRLVRDLNGERLEGWWRPGQAVLTPPWSEGASRSGPLRLLGLALDLDIGAACLGCDHLASDVARLEGAFLADRLLTSVLTALWHEVEAHGASSAFFEHGVALVLRRLQELPGPPVRPPAPRLGAKRFAQVAELIESRIDGDLSVRELADAVGRDPSGFTRAFRAETGVTPFAYLTLRRMERAKLLLATGEPVATVACAVGYANPGKFAAAFKRLCGLPPSVYQRRARE